MKAETWDLVKSTFAEAMEAPPEERAALVETLCADSREARREVQRMLACADSAVRVDDANPLNTAASSPDGSDAPRRIGRFAITDLIGRGGSGIVYRAIDTASDEVVAVKLLRLAIASEHAARRLEFEGELLATLRHDSIARVVEVGSVATEFGRLPYIAMEYVEGEPIDAYAAGRDLDDRACIELMVRVCDAVGYAHSLGIIHRDLKPANIFVTAEGDPKILDFGIARGSDGELSATSLCTQVGDVLGTPGYMSPEQCAGSAALANTRADVYSLGVILFELLARQRLFDLEGLPIHAALGVIARTHAPLIRDRRPELRGDIEAVLAKSLDRSPRRRYDTAAALAEDLRRTLDERTVAAEPVSGGYMTRRFLRRHRNVLIVSLIIIAVLSSIVVWQRGARLREAARLRVYSLAFAMHSEEAAEAVLSREQRLRAALPRAELSTFERLQLHDRLGNRLVSLYDGNPAWLAAALEHFRLAHELAPTVRGREHEQTLRALQIYCELLGMVGRADVAETLIRSELDFWDFTPERLPAQANELQKNRLLRLASTYGETLSRLGRHEEAVTYLHRVLAAQERFFADHVEHTDPEDTRTLIEVAERQWAAARGDG